MKSARIIATWEPNQGMPSPRRRKRPAAAALNPVTATPRDTIVELHPPANIQARVIAVLITGLALLIISVAGARMLGSEEAPAQSPAVLTPSEVFGLEQSSALERERGHVTRLKHKIELLVAAGQSSNARLKDKEERLREQGDVLRDRDDSLRKAKAQAEEATRQLRLAQADLEEKTRLLRDKEDLLRENEARLKTYESA